MRGGKASQKADERTFTFEAPPLRVRRALRTLRAMRPPRVLPAAALLALALTAPLLGQADRTPWRVRSDPGADLWFAGLAATETFGFGDLPLYDRGATRALRAMLASAGSGDALDGARDLHDAFAADSAFELLHFVPLYFTTADRDGMLAALRLVVERGSGAVAGLPSRERFGGSAVAATLRTPEQRRVLGAFLGHLGRWSAATDSFRNSAEVLLAVDAARARWTRLAGTLEPYLAAERLDDGVLLVSPFVGPDGRLFEGAPGARADNVLAVHLPVGADGGDAAYLAVRELCYPLVRRVAGRLPALADRVSAERTRGQAAVRCGALLLARYAPGEIAGYERTWLRVAGRREPFADAFALPEGWVEALQREIGAP